MGAGSSKSKLDAKVASKNNTNDVPDAQRIKAQQAQRLKLQQDRKNIQLQKLTNKINEIKAVEKENLEDLFMIYKRFKALKIDNPEFEKIFSTLMGDYIKRRIIQGLDNDEQIKFLKQRYQNAISQQTIGRKQTPDIDNVYQTPVKQAQAQFQARTKQQTANIISILKTSEENMSKDKFDEAVKAFTEYIKKQPRSSDEVDKQLATMFKKYIGDFYGPGNQNKPIYTYEEGQDPISTFIHPLRNSYYALVDTIRGKPLKYSYLVEDALSKATNWANNRNKPGAMDSMLAGLASTVSGAASGASGLASSAASSASGFASSAASGVSGLASSAASGASRMASGAKKSVSGILSSLKNAGSPPKATKQEIQSNIEALATQQLSSKQLMSELSSLLKSIKQKISQDKPLAKVYNELTEISESVQKAQSEKEKIAQLKQAKKKLSQVSSLLKQQGGQTQQKQSKKQQQ